MTILLSQFTPKHKPTNICTETGPDLTYVNQIADPKTCYPSKPSSAVPLHVQVHIVFSYIYVALLGRFCAVEAGYHFLTIYIFLKQQINMFI